MSGLSAILAYAGEQTTINLEKEAMVVATTTSFTGATNEENVRIKKLYDKVCKKQPNSPLCSIETLTRIKKIVDERLDQNGQWFEILIGITNAESSLATNFANDNVGGKCEGRNNLGGAKYRINDDNTRDYTSPKFEYGSHGRFTDKYNCNLFPFDSYDQYWASKANGMRF